MVKTLCSWFNFRSWRNWLNIRSKSHWPLLSIADCIVEIYRNFNKKCNDFKEHKTSLLDLKCHLLSQFRDLIQVRKLSSWLGQPWWLIYRASTLWACATSWKTPSEHFLMVFDFSFGSGHSDMLVNLFGFILCSSHLLILLRCCIVSVFTLTTLYAMFNGKSS